MAITYVNDLRLSEMGTGDNSGTWGTVTNTNLELIGEAFGFGTESITTNADTHASTIADGSTDPVRAMYVKYTGALDSNCTITIGPNTVNKFYFIENATTDSGSSGPYSLIISQGSGANITVPNGQTKAVYLDGAGSGAAVVDAFTALNVVDFTVQDDLSLSSDSAIINFGADSDITLTHAADTSLTLGGAGSTTGLLINNTATDGDPFLSFALSGTQTFTIGVDDGDSDKFKIGTTAIGTNTRMTIDSSGNVGIGDTAPDNVLNIKESALGSRSASNGNTSMTLEHATDTGIQFFSATQTQLRFGDAASTGAGSIIYTHSDNAMKFSTAETERMLIDGSGRVGIGGTPNTTWRDDIADQEVLMLGTELTLYSDAGVTTALLNNALINDADTYVNISERGASQYFQYQGAHKWYTAASASAGADINTEMTTQKMQLDISGNLIIGSDSASFNNTAKTVLRPGADNWAISPGVAYSFNRTGSSGDILEFYETSSNKAGVIGSASNSLFIGNDDAGILFNDHGGGDLDSILPYDVGSGALYNGHVDIGGSSNKFKNIHISGSLSTGDGITFGHAASGSSTSKTLDDYEEGTFTPRIRDGAGNIIGDSNNVGVYVKVGNLIHCNCSVTRSDSGSHTGNLQVTGFPVSEFTATNLVIVAGAIWIDNGAGSDLVSGTGYLNNSGYLLGVMDNRVDTSNRYMQATQVNNSRPVYASVTFRTT
jgi:hypothetical protein